MRYRLFGRSGLRVSEVNLGTMNFGNGEWGVDVAQSRAIMEAFADAGGTFLDTASVYADGDGERIVGDFIASDRDHFVIATKYALSNGTDLMTTGSSRRTMMQSVEHSLKRLGTDHIDLFYVHMWDFTTPIDELMRGFDDLVRSGKIVYAACSNLPAWQVSRANMLADLRGWAPFIGMQVEYSLVNRTPERDLLPMAAELDLGVVAWSPLANGALASPRGGRREIHRDLQANDRTDVIAAKVREIAEEIGVPPSQVALAALRRLDPSNHVLPIIGASSVEQLKTNLGFLDLTLEDSHVARLDEVSRVDMGYPHEFLRSDYIRSIQTGGKDHLLDDHRH